MTASQPGLPVGVAELCDRGQGRVVLLGLATDIDLAGRPVEQWLLATEKELLVAQAPDAGGVLRCWPLDAIAAFRSAPAIGCGFLQGQIDGVWVDLVRFSNRLAPEFAAAAAKLDRLVHHADFEIEPDDASARATCPTCGIRLKFPGDNCPRCIPPGRIAMRVAELLRPYRGTAAFMLALALASVGVELVPPLLQKLLVDRVLEPDQPPMDRSRLVVLLLTLVGGLAAVRLAAAGIAVWKGALASQVGASLTADLRSRMVRKLHELSVSYYDQNQVGMLMSRVSYDTEAMHTLMHQATGGFFLQLLQLSGIAVMLFWLNPRLAVFTLLPMPIVLAGSWFFARYLHPRHHSYWESVGRQASALTGMLSGIRVVKAFAREGHELQRFERSSHRLRNARQKVDVSTTTFSSLIGFTFGLGALIVWYVGGRGVIDREMTLGSLMAFLAYLAMFYTPLTSLTESTTWISNFLTASQRIFELLDTPSQVCEPRQPHAVNTLHGHVRFDKVSFSYNDRRRILDRVSFEIQPGEMVGIVGRSGSGKSTVVNLVSRMYDASSGAITIDGLNVRDIAMQDLRRHIGVVLQEPFLFEGTVEENIAYGNPAAPAEQVLSAAKAAAAHEFILRMPFAYETMLGERGAGLSGGERQRLSIARALLYDPRILILDEATSSIDSESERVIQEAIRRFSRGRTTIAIAHRLSTLRHADRLLVFDQGRLVEQGSPRELVAKNGIFASLLRVQSGLAGGRLMDRDDSGDPPERLESNGRPSNPDDGPEFEIRWLTPDVFNIHAGPQETLCLQRHGEDHRGVIAVRAFPSKHVDELISVQIQADNGTANEVGMIRQVSDWPSEAQELLRESLRRRYLLRPLHAIHTFHRDRGFLRCVARTDGGEVDFLVHSGGSAIKRFGRNGCLVVDVDDNCYVVPDVESLEPAHRLLIDMHRCD